MRILSFLAEESRRAAKPWLSLDPLVPLSTLTNLCLTSKYLQRLAEPLLYRSFDTDRDIMLCDFVYAILDKPRLCAHVQEVHISLSWTLSSYTNAIKSEMSEFFGAKAREYGLTQVVVEYNGEGLERLNDICVKLLCLKAPNLQRLSFYVGTETALQTIFTQDDETRVLAGNLQELYFEDTDPEYYGLNYGTDVLRYSGLFKSPKLEKIHFRVFDSIKQPGNGTNSYHRLGTYIGVKSLHFIQSVLSGDDIVQIGKSFPNIEDFEYGYKPVNDEQATGLRGAQLKEALNCWTETLKRLSLDFTFFYDDGRGDRKDDFIENMSAFRRLEELQVESLFLLRERSKKLEDGSHGCTPEAPNLWKDYFPPTLRRLRVNRVYRNVEGPLIKLAENVKEWLPDLEVVHISFGHWTATPGYADFDVTPDTPLIDLYEPILTDQVVAYQLNNEMISEEMTAISHPRWCGVEIPKRYVDGCNCDAKDPWSLTATAIKDYFGNRFSFMHLPILWQDIVTKLNNAGVKVKIDNMSQDSTSFDTQGQMRRVEWEPLRNVETKMYS